MKLLILPVLFLTGCSYGVATYSVKPFLINDKLYCCQADIINGKEIDEIELLLEKKGDDYLVHLKQRGVDAFRGQEITAGAASTAVKAGATVLLAPTAIPAAGALLQQVIE